MVRLHVPLLLILMGEERGRFLDETMKCKRYATEEMISRLPEVDDVSGRPKPARDGRMKTSHFKLADIRRQNCDELATRSRVLTRLLTSKIKVSSKTPIKDGGGGGN